MYQNLPTEWQEKITADMKTVSKQGFAVVDPQEAMKNRTLSVLIDFDLKQKEGLYELVRTAVPENLQSKIWLQPWEGYHLSIQWANEYSEEQKAFLVDNLEKISNKIGSFEAKVMGLYPSRPNLFFIVEAKLDVTSLRNEVSEVFERVGLTPKLPKNLNTLWISAIKFTEALNSKEVDQLVENLPKKEREIEMNRMVVVENDPFFTPANSQVLKRLDLSNS